MEGVPLTASSFTFRSGLDGDTRYFTSLAQAALAPCPLACCYLRSAADLLLPGLVLLCAVGPLTLFDRGATSVSLSRQLLFLATPYLVSLILFPQSVSIHPYLYDHLLMVPIVVTGATALLTDAVQGRLKGAGLLVLLLLMGGLDHVQT